MIGLMMLGAAAGSMTSSERAYVAAAKRCGFKPDQIVLLPKDKSPSGPVITPNGSIDSISFDKIECLMRWAAKHRQKIGFISQPQSEEAR